TCSLRLSSERSSPRTAAFAVPAPRATKPVVPAMTSRALAEARTVVRMFLLHVFGTTLACIRDDDGVRAPPTSICTVPAGRPRTDVNPAGSTRPAQLTTAPRSKRTITWSNHSRSGTGAGSRRKSFEWLLPEDFGKDERSSRVLARPTVCEVQPEGHDPGSDAKHDSVGQEDRPDRRGDGDCSQHVPGDVKHTTCWGRAPEGGEVTGDGTSGEGRAGRAAGSTADKVLGGRGRGCVFSGLVLGDFVDGFRRSRVPRSVRIVVIDLVLRFPFDGPLFARHGSLPGGFLFHLGRFGLRCSLG